MSGKRSRTKGHGFERVIAQLFREAGFPEARRKLEYHLNDCNGVDLQFCGPYAIQCKALRQYPAINTISEIKTNDPDMVHVLIAKADNKKPVAVLYLDDFMDMVASLSRVNAPMYTEEFTSQKEDLE